MRNLTNKLIKLLRLTILQALLLMVTFQAHAFPPPNTVYDSLSKIYVDVSKAGNYFIVNQGIWKALYDPKGLPVTAFDYLTIIPGLDGHFVGINGESAFLLDSNGNRLLAFSSLVNKVDTLNRLYKFVDNHGAIIYNASGVLLQDRSYDDNEYKKGFFRFYKAGDLQGVKDTSGNVILPMIYNGMISISGTGIVAMINDTAYAYDCKGKLRFQSPAQDCKMLRHGVVAIELYGLWCLKDSTGKALTHFKYGKVEDSYSGDYIDAENVILDYSGKELVSGYYTSIFNERGWYRLDVLNKTGNEIRDEQFKLVFEADDYERSEFIGNRFIKLYKKYNDNYGQIYDRKTRKFTNLKVVRSLAEDAYLLEKKDTISRQVLKGDKILSLPYFVSISPVESTPYFLISKNSNKEHYNDKPESITLNMTMIDYGSGLLDSNMKVILPLKYSNIKVLSKNLIAAQALSGSENYLFDADGKRLLTLNDYADITRLGMIVKLNSKDEYLLLDTMGHVLFRNRNQPSLLYPNQTESYPTTFPNLLLRADSSSYYGLYNLKGERLLPHEYFPVTQKVPGLYSLKKKDSLYFVNNNGMLLFNGRGFSGKKYFLLESYAVLLQNEKGKWGVLDANGNEVQPFVYDTAGNIAQPGIGYFVGKENKFSLMDNMGRLRYSMETWLPFRYLGHNYYQDNAQHYYELRQNKMNPVSLFNEYIQEKVFHFSYQTTTEVTNQGFTGLPSGIYNRRLQRLAPFYPDFSYYKFQNKTPITDSLKKNIAVIDTSGNLLMPFIPNPDLLVVDKHAIIAIYKKGNDLLFREDSGKYIKEEIVIAPDVKKSLLEESGSYHFTNDKPLIFNTTNGGKALVTANGYVLWDKGVTAVYYDEYLYRIKRAGKWGLLNGEGKYIQQPVSDSIAYYNHDFLIFANGLKGIYSADARAYIRPVYDEIYSPQSLSNGFLIVKKDNGFTIINKKEQVLLPLQDSITTSAYWLRDIAAYKNGNAIPLSINDDGSVGLNEGIGQRKIGINGHYGSIVIVKEGGLYGLYNNDSLSTILPASYDAIEWVNDNYLIAWKYKADKHQGMDSTVVISDKGKILFRFKGWRNPFYENGYWYINGQKNTPVVNSKGKTIVPEGYEITEILNDALFIVKKDGKTGIINANGIWTLKPVTDEIDFSDYNDYGFMKAQIKNTSVKNAAEKYYLIGKDGKRIGTLLYNEIEFDENGGVRYKNGESEGYIIKPKPHEESEEED